MASSALAATEGAVVFLPAWLDADVSAAELAANLTALNDVVDSFPIELASPEVVEAVDLLRKLFDGETPIDNIDEELRATLARYYENSRFVEEIIDQSTRAAEGMNVSATRFAEKPKTAQLLRLLTPPAGLQPQTKQPPSPPAAVKPTAIISSTLIPLPPGRHQFKLTLKGETPVLRLYPEATPHAAMVTSGEKVLGLGKMLFVAENATLFFNPNELYGSLTRNGAIELLKTILGDRVEIR